ncbi:hypothetical protein PCE1_004598 [Barthelona sp. PCE]
MAPKKNKKNKKKTKKTDSAVEGIDYEKILSEKEAQINDLTEQLLESEQQRNFMQLGRDRLENIVNIKQKEVDKHKALLRVRDREAEEAQEDFKTRLMLYKQHSHHLMFEYQNNQALQKKQHEEDLRLQSAEYRKRETALKSEIQKLKTLLREQQVSHDESTRTLMQNFDKNVTALRIQHLERIQQMTGKYEQRLNVQRQELEDRLKNELLELEDRKNEHIGQLMRQHEESFIEIKTYYSDITRNNLSMIKTFKNKVEEQKKQEIIHEKLIFELAQDNKRLKEPLDKSMKEVERLKSKLNTYEKDKQSLKNTKRRLHASEKSLKQIEWEYEVLEQRFQKLQENRDQLYDRFESLVYAVQQRAGVQNIVLTKKLESLKTELEKRDVQLSEILQVSGMPMPDQHNDFNDANNVITLKNQTIVTLEKEVATVTKRYNDFVNVMEAKLQEYGIPVEELGFKPVLLESVEQTTAPANLVTTM